MQPGVLIDLLHPRVQEPGAVEVLRVDFFADQHEAGLGVVHRAALARYGRQAAEGVLVHVPSAPGAGEDELFSARPDEKQLGRVEAIIYSMTKAERNNPDLLNPSRKQRIAKGAGVDISEVNRLVKQFEQARKMMKSMGGMMGGKGKRRRGGFNLPFGF